MQVADYNSIHDKQQLSALHAQMLVHETQLQCTHTYIFTEHL